MPLFNPFKKLTSSQLDGLLQKRYYYLSAQTFKRGFPFYSKANKDCLLLTAYETQFEAKTHAGFWSRKGDLLSAFINTRLPSHLQAARRLLEPASIYDVYSGNTPTLTETLFLSSEKFHPYIKAYLNQQVDVELDIPLHPPPKLEIIYGEIWALLIIGKKEMRIRLEDIERV